MPTLQQENLLAMLRDHVSERSTITPADRDFVHSLLQRDFLSESEIAEISKTCAKAAGRIFFRSVKKSDLPTSKRHVHLYDEDWDFLLAEFGPGGQQRHIGVSAAIRAIVHQKVLGMKAAAAKEYDRIAAGRQKESVE